jgi:Ran-binding protein 9/10
VPDHPALPSTTSDCNAYSPIWSAMADPYRNRTSSYSSNQHLLAGIAAGHPSSYASVASGSADLGTTARPPGTAISYLLNPLSHNPDDFSARSTAAPQRSEDDETQDEPSQGRLETQPWSSAGPHLQSFSRAFEPFMSKDYNSESNGNGSGSSISHQGRLLMPSYLKGSLYAQRLEEAWRTKMLAQKENASAQNPASSGTQSGGNLGVQVANGHSKLGGAASYRGMTFEVIEKVPHHLYSEDEATITPLPSRWNKEDKYGGLEVLGVDGFEVKYTGHRQPGEREHEACAIRADTYMPPQCGIYYFEVTVLNRKRDDTTIGIGFSSKSVSLSRVPGWEPESWGYHGDDGNIYASQNVGKSYNATFGAGDCIGCGINFNKGQAFFTRNGQYLGVAFSQIKGNSKLYPSVGLKRPGEHIWANFGQVPFQFSIDNLVQVRVERTFLLYTRPRTVCAM